jgi:hypothetical protein
VSDRRRRPADRSSARVLLDVPASVERLSLAPSLVQCKCACGSGATAGLDEHCERCRGKALQRSATDLAVAIAPVPAALPDAEHAAVARLGGGRPLDGATRARMEHGFRFDFSRIRVHADASGDAAANALGARAFTYGQRAAPSTSLVDGRHHVGHGLG